MDEIPVPRIIGATVTSISNTVYGSCNESASAVTQLLIGIPNSIYNEVSKMLRNSLAEVVKRYMLVDDVDAALKELQSFVDLNRFAVFLAWLEVRYGVYGLKGFSIIREFESGNILTVGVLLENCGKDEWSEIAGDVKSYLNSHGLADIAGRVSIICLKGLKELGIEIKQD
jgi:hypothetical protein